MHKRSEKSWFFHVEKDENNKYSLSWQGLSYRVLFLIIMASIIIAIIYNFPYLGKVMNYFLGGK
ncbi:hypothetical protein CT138_08995 [Mannheimia varigena]|nr:hypothetical protein CT138_08995 [Mannheimia varigena]